MLSVKSIYYLGMISGFSGIIGLVFIVLLMGHYLLNGTYSPYKAFGFIGLGFIIFSLLVLLIAIITDMINRVLKNQEKILYEMKKSRYDK